MMRILVVAFLLTASSAAAAPLELARVNGEPITERDLKAAFVGKHGGHTAFLGGEVEARRFLEIVINERLLIQEAYNLGLDGDPSVKPQVDEYRDRRSAEHLAKVEIEMKATPSPEEIRAAWEKAKDLYLAREIVLERREEAEAVRRSLLGGTDFETMARTCSVGRTRTRGGSMAAFTWGSLTPEIEEAAAALEPGEISAVIRGPEGWTILMLIDKVEAHRPDLDERISQRIEIKLKERRIETLTSAFSDFLWREYAAEIVAPLRSTAETVVARWRGGEMKVADAFTEAERRTLPPARLEAILRSAVNTQLIRLEARRRKIAEVPEVAEAVDAYEAKLIESALYAKHVLTGVKVGDDEVRDAYDKQKDSLVVPEKRRVAHIAVASEKEAVELRKRIHNGEDFVELLKKYSLDTPTIKTGGDVGWIEKGKVASIYEPLFELPVGGVSDPMASPNSWHLIRVTEIEPAHPLAFDEAKEKLRTQILEKKKHDAREYWIGKLREASEIEVLDEGIRAFVAAH